MCARIYIVILHMEVLTWVNHVYKPSIVNIMKLGNSKAKENIMGDSF